MGVPRANFGALTSMQPHLAIFCCTLLDLTLAMRLDPRTHLSASLGFETETFRLWAKAQS